MKENENEKITNIKTLFVHYADGDNDQGWYMYEKSFRKAMNRRTKEIITFLKYNTGLKIDADMITNLTEKLK